MEDLEVEAFKKKLVKTKTEPQTWLSKDNLIAITKSSNQQKWIWIINPLVKAFSPQAKALLATKQKMPKTQFESKKALVQFLNEVVSPEANIDIDTTSFYRVAVYEYKFATGKVNFVRFPKKGCFPQKGWRVDVVTKEPCDQYVLLKNLEWHIWNTVKPSSETKYFQTLNVAIKAYLDHNHKLPSYLQHM